MKINFFSEDVPFKISKASIIRNWINTVARNEGRTIREINYIFCSDAYLHTINLQYLSHDTYTDIITFDHSELEETLAGDVFISIERIEDNSRVYKTSFQEELHRVLIHGILHLCGYSDKTETDEDVMRKKEDACLSLLHMQ